MIKLFNRKKRFKKQWENNLSEEMDFWVSLASKKNKQNPEWVQNFHQRATNVHDFPADLEKYLPESQEHIKALDVGAGPVTQLGSKHEWRTIDLTPIDPLAEEYDKMLNEFDIEIAHPKTISCDAEDLTSKFDRNSFDFIYSRNALDHSYDPMKGIQQIIEVLKPGCVFYLWSFINEGKAGNYHGLHQWNFDLTDTHDDFVIWNQSKNISVKSNLSDNIAIEAGATPNGECLYAAIKKV